MMETIRADSYILVYRDRRRKWLVRPMDTPKLHTHLGILDCSALVGSRYGTSATTTLNDELHILKPTLEDIVMKFARRTQVIYPKDLAMIVMKCAIHSGSRVFEAGTGSGAATAMLAYMVAPEGRVYSYDVNGEFQNVARKNLERFGLLKYVTLSNRDAKEGIEESDLDAALVDMGDPWELVRNVKGSLSPSATISAVCPTMNQAERLSERLRDEAFINLETIEILVRNIEARAGMTRPSMMMVGHTAYLTFGRKTDESVHVSREPSTEQAGSPSADLSTLGEPPSPSEGPLPGLAE